MRRRKQTKSQRDMANYGHNEYGYGHNGYSHNGYGHNGYGHNGNGHNAYVGYGCIYDVDEGGWLIAPPEEPPKEPQIYQPKSLKDLAKFATAKAWANGQLKDEKIFKEPPELAYERKETKRKQTQAKTAWFKMLRCAECRKNRKIERSKGRKACKTCKTNKKWASHVIKTHCGGQVTTKHVIFRMYLDTASSPFSKQEASDIYQGLLQTIKTVEDLDHHLGLESIRLSIFKHLELLWSIFQVAVQSRAKWFKRVQVFLNSPQDWIDLFLYHKVGDIEIEWDKGEIFQLLVLLNLSKRKTGRILQGIINGKPVLQEMWEEENKKRAADRAKSKRQQQKKQQQRQKCRRNEQLSSRTEHSHSIWADWFERSEQEKQKYDKLWNKCFGQCFGQNQIK